MRLGTVAITKYCTPGSNICRYMPAVGSPGSSVNNIRVLNYEVDLCVDYLKMLAQLQELLNKQLDEKMTT